MKDWKTGLVIAGLILICALGLCACGGPDGQDQTETLEPASITTEAALKDPVLSDVSLIVEPDGTCKLYEIGGLQYFEAGELSALCGGGLSTALHGHLLRLSVRMLDRDAIFLEGKTIAKTADGDEIDLDAEVIPTDQGLWFLPLSTLKSIWGRELVADPEQNRIRCLAFTPCAEAVLINGTPVPDCLSCGGTLMLPVEQSMASLDGSVSADPEESGARKLTLQFRDREMILTEGAGSALVNGESLLLDVPAVTREERWYFPAAAAAEALGGTLITDSTKNRTDLMIPTESAYLWFGGRGLGRCQRIGEADYTGLTALAEQLGAALEQDGDLVSITALEHSLTYRGGSVNMLVDGEEKELQTPVIRTEEDWLIPVRQFAEALGVPELKNSDAGLVFSLMEPCETVLWIDGKKTSSCQLRNSAAYVDLTELAAIAGGSLEAAENTAVLSVWGKTLTLNGGSAEVEIDGDVVSMSAPAAADGAAWSAPANDFLEAVGLSVLEDPDIDQIFYTRIVRNDEIAEGYRVPVLMYHAVSDYMWGIPELFISPSTLEEQLKALVEGGYTAITFEDLDHIAEIEKPVMLTFDDGYNDNYTELFPLLKKYNVKATVFVIVNDMERVHNLTKEQVREMSDSGLVSIQSHTMSHGYLNGMGANQLEYEHYQSMLALARIAGKQPFVICYPTGKNSYFSRSYTAKYYQFGLCMGGPCYETGADPYLIYRYYIPRNTALSKFLEYIG